MQAVEGAILTLGLNQSIPSQTTDENGRARIYLTSSEWQVHVQARSFASFQQTVDLSDGREKDIRVELVPAGSIFGRITDEKGREVPASVRDLRVSRGVKFVHTNRGRAR